MRSFFAYILYIKEGTLLSSEREVVKFGQWPLTYDSWIKGEQFIFGCYQTVVAYTEGYEVGEL